jgi:transitional endoplasmic reticulum ATPase
MEGIKTSNVNLDQLVEKTGGFVHADIRHLCISAKSMAIERNVKSNEENFKKKVQYYEYLREKQQKKKSFTDQTSDEQQNLEPVTPLCPVNLQTEVVVLLEDFLTCLRKIKPSALRGYFQKEYNVGLNQVIGYENVKQKIVREVSYPIKYHNIYKANNLKNIRGIILEGPPGTGKTTLAKALATQIEYNFISISSTDLLSKYVGQTESRIQEVFERARNSQPCLVFIDELDGVFGNSRGARTQAHQISKLSQFLSLMDGMTTEGNVIFVATTNKKQLLDPALLRSGRFELILHMGYPNKKQLIDLYEYYFKQNLCGKQIGSHIINVSLKNRITGADLTSIKRIAIAEKLACKRPNELGLLEQSANALQLTDEQILKALMIHLRDTHRSSVISVQNNY